MPLPHPLPLSRRPPSLTLEVELLDGVPGGLFLALVVGQGGLLQTPPSAGGTPSESVSGPEVWREGSGQATSSPPSSPPHWACLQQGCQGWTQTHRKIRRWSLSSGMVVRLSWGEEGVGGHPDPALSPDPSP